MCSFCCWMESSGTVSFFHLVDSIVLVIYVFTNFLIVLSNIWNGVYKPKNTIIKLFFSFNFVILLHVCWDISLYVYTCMILSSLCIGIIINNNISVSSNISYLEFYFLIFYVSTPAFLWLPFI